MRLRTGVTGWRAPEGPMLNATMPSAFSWGLAQVHQQDAAVRDQPATLVGDGDLPELGVPAALEGGRLDPQLAGPYRPPDRGVVADSHRPVPRRLLEAKPQQLVERAVLVLVIEVHQRSTPRPPVKSSVPARPGSP